MPEIPPCELPNCTPPIPGEKAIGTSGESQTDKPIVIQYFTDPICSTCWGMEPYLRRFKLEYGHLFELQYHMGGLVPSWKEFDRNGIRSAEDVARHWEEKSLHYQMPIDGDIWIEDPLSSSIPASLAFIAAQLQHFEKAEVFLRRLREMVFVQKQNIARLEVLEQTAIKCGLDAAQLRADMISEAVIKFHHDLDTCRSINVQHFPTFYFSNRQGKIFCISGYSPYSDFETALAFLFPEVEKWHYNPSIAAICEKYQSITLKELMEIGQIDAKQALLLLESMVHAEKMSVVVTRNGNLYRMN